MIQCEAIAHSSTISVAVPSDMEGHRLKIIIIDDELNFSSSDNIDSMRKELVGLTSFFSVNWNKDEINSRFES